MGRIREAKTMKGYQENFSDMHPEIYFDANNRAQKAEKMLRILRDHIGADLSRQHVLDVGCSTGTMCQILGEHFHRVTGIDIDAKAITHAREVNTSPHIKFRVGDAMQTGLPDESIDVVVCAHVYEHVPDPWRMMDEIRRILTPGGVCYFAAENRLVFREGDYRLPFLSMLPKFLAHRYLRVTGRGDHYYETLYTYWTLRNLVRGFERIDYTRRVIADPVAFAAVDLVAPGSAKQWLALFIADTTYWLFPDYIWLLRKSGTTDSKLSK